jgi:hypothetical protein
LSLEGIQAKQLENQNPQKAAEKSLNSLQYTVRIRLNIPYIGFIA